MTKLKYLWATALVALCLSLGSGLALAADKWTVANQDIPNAIEWDKAADSSVEITNTGDTTFNSKFGLESVEGVTTAAIPINRWGLTLVPIAGVSVPPQFNFLFEFTITGPPITNLKYDLPVTATEPGTVSRFDCNWILAKDITPTSGKLITSDTVEMPVAVSRFPDIEPHLPPATGSWARFWVEELAGKVPLVVQGFPDGTYRPVLAVTRDQMAVYIARALKLPTEPFTAEFSDIDRSFWAAPWILALVKTNIVQGYPDNTYRPAVVVSRDQMAVFMARGIAGGDSKVPSGPAIATFPDVPTSFWAFKYIEFAVDEGIVQGYPDNTYRPTDAVDRAQMAVFVWRSFVMPSKPGSVVILAGPAVTSVEVAKADYVGYTSIASGAQADPGFAYVGFDAVRLSSGLVFPHTPTGRWTVRFDLLPAGSPTPALTKLFLFTAAEISAARTAAFASGEPYFFVAPKIDSGLAKGDYTLVVSVSDETGALLEVQRQPRFRIR